MNVSSLLRGSARRAPDRPALLFRGRPVSYAALEALVNRAAAAFAEAGVEAGDRVALLLGNVPEFVSALYGAFRAGAVAVPLNVMLTPEEVGYVLADARAKAVVAEMEFIPTVLAVRDRLADLETVFVVAGPPVPSGTVSFEEAMGRAGLPPAREVGEDDLALLQYTAGTTADPKGAMLTHGNLLANLEQVAAVPALKEAEDDVVLLVLPLFHIYALNVVLGTAIRVGATTVLVERFEPVETLELVARHGVTVLPGAPPMFAAWLRLAAARREALASVRLAVSGAAALPAELLESFRERFGVTIWEGYGLTEAGPAVTTTAMGPVAKGGSIGLPLPGVEVRLVDDEGEDVEEGDPGEIVVRGPGVFRGYFGREDETAASFIDGWLRTGDVAYRDDEGYLFLVDRKKDLVIVSGFNVYPREVEEVLAQHPSVADVAVVGVPDEHTGEAVKALVVPRPGTHPSPPEIIDHASRYLARFKVPTVVEFVAELPRHVTGKVLRRLLREGGEAAEPPG